MPGIGTRQPSGWVDDRGTKWLSTFGDHVPNGRVVFSFQYNVLDGGSLSLERVREEGTQLVHAIQNLLDTESVSLSPTAGDQQTSVVDANSHRWKVCGVPCGFGSA